MSLLPWARTLFLPPHLLPNSSVTTGLGSFWIFTIAFFNRVQTLFFPVTALTRHVAVGDGVVHVWERELFPCHWSLEDEWYR